MQRRRFWIRYLVSVGLIAGLSAALFIAAALSHRHAAQDTDILNVSGQQRMLVQRIAWLLASDADVTKQALARNALNKLEVNQNYLTTFVGFEGAPAHATQALSTLYFTPEVGLAVQIEEFIGLGHRILSSGPNQAQAARARLEEMAGSTLSALMQRAAELHAQHAEDCAENYFVLQRFTFAALLFILSLEAALVVGPLLTRVHKDTARLRAKDTVLEVERAARQTLEHRLEKLSNGAANPDAQPLKLLK